ncbi:MAG: energy transducer TonB, partial [Bacteroidaceae bacterium]
MTPELTYFLKVNVAIVLFYAFYRSCCTQDTFLHSRRFVLLSFFAVAWLYPGIDLNAWFQDEAPIQGLAVIYAQSFSLGGSAPGAVDSFSWSDFLINTGILVYEVGVAILLLKLLVQLGALVRLALQSSPVNEELS